MKEFERVEIESRDELRHWLAENHTRDESIWLVSYKKHVPNKYVSWDEIVEEALCFGWIDSVPRKLDADRSMLLLSPRRKGSPWSRRNKQHIEKLIANGRITTAGTVVIEQAKADGSWSIYDDIEVLVIPAETVQLAQHNVKANYPEARDFKRKSNK